MSREVNSFQRRVSMPKFRSVEKLFKETMGVPVRGVPDRGVMSKGSDVKAILDKDVLGFIL